MGRGLRELEPKINWNLESWWNQVGIVIVVSPRVVHIQSGHVSPAKFLVLFMSGSGPCVPQGRPQSGSFVFDRLFSPPHCGGQACPQDRLFTGGVQELGGYLGEAGRREVLLNMAQPSDSQI